MNDSIAMALVMAAVCVSMMGRPAMIEPKDEPAAAEERQPNPDGSPESSSSGGTPEATPGTATRPTVRQQ